MEVIHSYLSPPKDGLQEIMLMMMMAMMTMIITNSMKVLKREEEEQSLKLALRQPRV